MKKFIALLLALVMVLAFAGCAKNADNKGDVKSEGVMTYEEYIAAALDTEVVIET